MLYYQLPPVASVAQSVVFIFVHYRPKLQAVSYQTYQFIISVKPQIAPQMNIREPRNCQAPAFCELFVPDSLIRIITDMVRAGGRMCITWKYSLYLLALRHICRDR